MSKNRAEKLLKFRAFGTMGCLVLLLSLFHSRLQAQHLRIFACAIANDSAGASLGASSEGSGLYQSDDTGKTWKHLGWSNIKCYSMDMVQSSNGRIIYEATGLGILRSTDYGEHWNQITDWRVSEAMDVAVNQKNPNEIYIATAHGPWRTRDGGVTWEFVKWINPPYCSRVMYSPDSLQLGEVVICGEGGIFWRRSSDSSWISPINGPTDIRDLSFYRETWYSYVHGKRMTSQGWVQMPDSGKSNMWIAASGKNGLYFSSKGLEGFAGARYSHRSLDTMPVWCICENDGHRIVGGPDGWTDAGVGGDFSLVEEHLEQKNVSACLLVGRKPIIGTLGEGVYTWGEHHLPHRQIWTLKSFLVSP